MAIAERFLRERFGTDVQHHHIFAIVSDGDLMEGIASEAASLAGHLRLGRLVYLYDDNDISLDGPTSLASTEDVDASASRPTAGTSRRSTTSTTSPRSSRRSTARVREEERPSLIRVRSIIGYPSPNKQGTSEAHGSPLGEDEVRLTKEAMGLDPDLHVRRARRRRRAHEPGRARRGAAGRVGAQMRAWRDARPRARGRVGRRVGRAGRCRAPARRCAR